MSVTAEICPSCGAPLTLEGTRCAFCHVPLVVATGGAVTSPASATIDPDAPFAMQVEDVFVIKGRGTIATGRIASGSVCVGDALVLDGVQGQTKTKCTGIEMFRKQMDVAVAGNNVGLMLDGVDRKKIASGDWLRAATR